jgi:hypothetical protein
MKQINVWKRIWSLTKGQARSLMSWIVSLFEKKKNHKMVVKTKCKDGCCCNSSCLLVYNEKNESTDDSGSDIEYIASQGIIKVK